MKNFLAMAATALAYYPIVEVNEWQAVTGDGWTMDGNFYVVTEYQNANPKFGVSTGISPPADETWTVGNRY